MTDPRFAPPFAPPRPVDHGARNIVLAVLGGFGGVMFFGLALVALIAAVAINQPVVPQADDPVPPPWMSQPTPAPADTAAPEAVVPEIDPPATSEAGTYETSWKAGEGWETPPPSVKISRFNADFKDPADWLASIDRLPPGMKVVVTDDETYNCGWTLVYQPDNQVGGCYRSEFGTTLFLYWGDNADDDMKELVLLHELSHFAQQWDHFDAVTSANQSTVSSSEITKVTETDATCRVYFEWGYDRYRDLDDATSAPCGNADWDPTWLERKLTAKGVSITDW